MKLKAINEAGIDTNGTSLIGRITTTRGELTRVFGEPYVYSPLDGDGKVRFEWQFYFESDDGNKVATIHDYKTKHTLESDEPYHWSIGSADKSVFDPLVDAFIQRGGKYQGASVGVYLG